MKNEKLINALNNIDDKYIIEAHAENKKGFSFGFSLRSLGKLALAGVCLVLVVTIIPAVFNPPKYATDSAISNENWFNGPDYNYADQEMVTDKESASNSAVKDEAVMIEKLIVTGNMSLETLEYDELINRLQNEILQRNGYTQSCRSVNSGSRYYEATIRIPSDLFNDFVEQVKGLGNCISYSESADDITTQYYDVESRLNSLKAEEERVMEFYKKAENISELMEIEGRLTDIRSEINRLETTMKNWDLLTSYSTLNLSVRETKVYTEVSESFVDRLANSFSRGFRNFTYNIETLILNLAYNLWTFLVIILIGVIGFFTVKKFRNRKK